MKHKICKGKIYVNPMPIQGVLKHFAENFKLQFQPALVKSETYFFDFALLRCSLTYEKLGQTERKAK